MLFFILLVGLSSSAWAYSATKCVPYNSEMITICSEWEKIQREKAARPTTTEAPSRAPSSDEEDPYRGHFGETVYFTDGSVRQGDVVYSKEQWESNLRFQAALKSGIEEGKYTVDTKGNVILSDGTIYAKKLWKSVVYAHFNIPWPVDPNEELNSSVVEKDVEQDDGDIIIF